MTNKWADRLCFAPYLNVPSAVTLTDPFLLPALDLKRQKTKLSADVFQPLLSRNPGFSDMHST